MPRPSMRLAILFKHPLKALKYLEGQSSQHITLDHQRTFLQTLCPCFCYIDLRFCPVAESVPIRYRLDLG